MMTVAMTFTKHEEEIWMQICMPNLLVFSLGYSSANIKHIYIAKQPPQKSSMLFWLYLYIEMIQL